MRTVLTPPPSVAFARPSGDCDSGDGDITTELTDVGGDTSSVRPSCSFASLATHTLYFSFVVCTILLSQGMMNNYDQVDPKISSSTQLLNRSFYDNITKKILEENITAKISEKDVLLERAKELKREGNENIKQGEEDEETANRLREKASLENKEVSVLDIRIKNDEEQYETLKESAASLSNNTSENVEEKQTYTFAGMSIVCEGRLQFFCDSIGRVTKFGKTANSGSNAEDLKAALEANKHAMNIHEKEVEKINLRYQLKKQAKYDSDKSQTLEERANTALKKGNEEIREAEKDRADANQLKQTSVEEAISAQSLKATVREDANIAKQLHTEALENATAAYVFGIFSAIFAVIALFIFSLRFINNFGTQTYSCIADRWSFVAYKQKTSANHGFDVSSFVKHWVAVVPKAKAFRFVVSTLGLLASSSTFEDQWKQLEYSSVHARGALVIQCSIVSGLSQSIVLFTVPALLGVMKNLELPFGCLKERDTMKIVVKETLSYFVLSLILSTSLSVIFILIFLLMARASFIAFVCNGSAPLLWLLFALGSYVYVRVFRRVSNHSVPIGRGSESGDITGASVSTLSQEDVFKNEDASANIAATEHDRLLDKEWGLRFNTSTTNYEVAIEDSEDETSDEMDILLDNSIRSWRDGLSVDKPSTGEKWAAVTKIIANTLRLPFEILVLLLMFAILESSISHCHELQPLMSSLQF